MEYASGVDTTEREHHVQPIIVDHAHAEIGGDIAVMTEALNRARNRSEPAPHGFPDRDMLRRPVRSPQKEGQAENGEPQRAERPGNTFMLVSRSVQAEKRLRGQIDEDEHENEQDNARDIPERVAQSRPAPDLSFMHQ